jgi:hypothetical protein
MALQAVQLSESEIFSSSQAPGDGNYLYIDDWSHPVTYFVGRNGSGKSRAGRVIAQKVPGSLYLSTDRLLGWMNVRTNTYGATINDFQGVPLIRDANASHYNQQNRISGMATEQLSVLREQPEVGLRVAAFIQKALGRVINLRETAGFLDPFIQLGSREYSLLRDEGHGLRELVVLLTAVYRKDWSLLVVDEPELHLHPSMTRLWISELDRECSSSGRNALVITHEPTIVRPTSADHLRSMWLFDVGRYPLTIASRIDQSMADRVSATLRTNPQLVSQLVFAPRPVLVEGPSDVIAMTTAISRLKEPSVVAQTEFVPCGSSNNVALWFSIARDLGLGVRAVADLDAILNNDVQRIIDQSATLQTRYRNELFAEPPVTHVSLRPILDAANEEKVAKDPKSRARWLADLSAAESGVVSRRDKLIEVWREEGLWLHPQGTLEDVLKIEKGKADVAEASNIEGDIDAVVDWCAFELDTHGEVAALLRLAVERIANSINQAHGVNPGATFHEPVGNTAVSDARMVNVEPLENGRHRLTVKLPSEFAGHYLDFDRTTPVSEMFLLAPEADSLVVP